eukprot:jgi/Ulvmu1/4132/UM019_0111.1
MKSVVDLAQQVATRSYVPPSCFQRIYKISIGPAVALAGPKLCKKYGVSEISDQAVVCVTNRITGDQTWYNEQRTRKPQTFTAKSTGPVDPIANPAIECDFCQWHDLTAADTFGRFQTDHAVTASNLFKYCQPCHGVVLFKHHDPLHFEEHHVRDLLLVSHQWFAAAHAEHPGAQHPLFIWNCLARAGASQFHGHAQIMLSEEPFPDLQKWLRYEQADDVHALPGLWGEMIAAHAAVGLLTAVRLTAPDVDSGSVFIWPSLAPVKDMEIVLVGKAICDAAFVKALHSVLRVLIDELDVKAFNVAIFGIDLEEADARYSPVQSSELMPDGIQAPAGSTRPPRRPTVARIVSRGKLSSKASDFGALEVLAGASIGHTDPFLLHAAITDKLQAPVWTQVNPEELL